MNPQKRLLVLIVSLAALQLLAVHGGWLDIFFFGSDQANVRGIDFFAVPKSFLNLLDGRSAFDTWGGQPWGPHATWYLAHPAFSVFVASWFSFFEPWSSYFLFSLFSAGLFAFSAWLIAREYTSWRAQVFVCSVMILAFPVYWTIYVGNMHAPLVLSLTLIFLSFLRYRSGNLRDANQLLMAGLLISFFSKPVVILMLPLLLMVPETRTTAFRSGLIYAAVSLVFQLVPSLNPQGMPLSDLVRVATDPEFVKENMNIFKNNFVLNGYMKDNSIHWLNLVAQSEHRLLHVDVFSLPVFAEMLAGKAMPAALFKLPVWFCLALSFVVPFLRDRQCRLDAALALVTCISISFFLSYNTVWEYQYASVLPAIALLPLLKNQELFRGRWLLFFTAMGLLIALPSLYFLVRGGDMLSPAVQSIIRSTRVVPVSLFFAALILRLAVSSLRRASFAPVRKAISDPDSVFF